jgi:Ca2+-binding RTX toxin-like protein
MSVTTRKIAAAIAVIMALAQPGVSRADFTFSNGFFDEGNINGWYAVGGYGAYDWSHDADGDSQSGSALLINQAQGANATATLRRCVGDVASNQDYFLTAMVALRSGEGAQGSASIAIEFYTGTGCGGNLTDVVEADPITDGDGRGRWFAVDIGAHNAGVHSIYPWLQQGAAIRATVVKTTAGGALSALFDSISFAPVGTPLCRGVAATQFGTNGPDTIVGTAGDDVLVGLGGDDVIDGLGGNDLICGGGGNDTLRGGGGRDRIYGERGDDVIRGGAGKDALFGGPGRDKVLGSGGADQLYGGSSPDTIGGGRGYDACHPDGSDTSAPTQCEFVAPVEQP